MKFEISNLRGRHGAQVVAACAVLPLASVGAGCEVSCQNGATFARGVDESHVQARLGVPDLVSESSGDQTRFYPPDDRPTYFWPRDARVSLYYLNDNLDVQFDEDGLCGCEPISTESLRMVRWALQAERWTEGAE